MSWIITGKEANPPLLDAYPGAAAAYSLRQLQSGSYPVVRVRRDSDNAEQDFTAAEVSDGTLAAWVGAGNDGFVRTWYDQSGNGNDVGATTTSQQPLIVSSGALSTENGNPAITYNDDLLKGECPITSTSNYFITTVYRIDTEQNVNPRYFAINLAGSLINLQLGHNSDSKYFNRVDSVTTLSTNTYSVLGSTNLLSWGSSASALTFSRNGVLTSSGSGLTPSANSTIGDGLFIFKGYIELDYYSKTGKIQELIVYSSDQSSNRAGIEANINAHYSIF